MSDSEQQSSIRGRVTSIDALRGFDMLWIIGAGLVFQALGEETNIRLFNFLLPHFDHMPWEGFHLWELIAPLFLFVVGAVLPFSLARRRERGENLGKLHLHIVKRTVVLIALGMVYNGLLCFDFEQMRWPGVLQQIAIGYFFAALLVVNTRWQTQALVAGAVLLSYWAAIMFIPVPGYGAGVITMEGCLPAYLDKLLIPGEFYYTGGYTQYGDNEGFMSVYSAIAVVLLGALAGHWLRSNRSDGRKTAGLAVAGVVSLIAGYAWGQSLPIIETIWTSSFVLFAVGWSLLLLALFYWVIDIKGYKKWAFFFIVIGMNPILIYVLQEFVNFDGIAAFFVQGIAEHTGMFKVPILMFSSLMAKWLFLWFLYRHKIFFKI